MLANLQVDHCPRCGKVFQKNMRNLCSACSQQYDRELTSCTDYLRRDRKADNQRLSEATGVSYKQIVSFIMERKLSLYDYPNLCYHCELCETPIRAERLCLNCRTRLSGDISRMKEADERKKLQQAHSFRIRDR